MKYIGGYDTENKFELIPGDERSIPVKEGEIISLMGILSAGDTMAKESAAIEKRMERHIRRLYPGHQVDPQSWKHWAARSAEDVPPQLVHEYSRFALKLYLTGPPGASVIFSEATLERCKK